MKGLIPGALAICLAAALWGLDGVVLTPRLHPLPVLFVVFLLHLIPFVIMQPIFFGCYRRLFKLSRGDWVVLGLVALTGGIVGTFAIVKALFSVDFNQLSVVVLLQKLQPVFAISLAALILKEPLSIRFVSWATTAILGAYLLTFGLSPPVVTPGAEATAGAAWATLAAAAYGSATVFGKKLLSSLDFKQATFGRYGLTVALATVFLALAQDGFPFGEVSNTQWLLIVVIGLTTGSGAIYLFYYGLSRVPATVSAICELCLPLTAILLDYWINDSLLTGWQWIGAILLIAAILKVSNVSSGAARSRT